MDTSKINKFFLYARKSTDDEERQILSIEAQITELREFAKREDINVIEEFIEKKSAKNVRCPGDTIHFMRFGYRKYIRRVVKLTGSSLSGEKVEKRYGNWSPY